MKVFISGPITGTADYVERFERVETLLTDKGYTVINPVKVTASLPKDTTHHEYMTVTIPLVDMADTIFMMKDYRKSEGAREELFHAKRFRKIPVIYEDDLE